MHTTNYRNTFLEVADDCPAKKAEAPPIKSEKTIARIQYEMIRDNPYKYTSDDVVFAVFAIKNNIQSKRLDDIREKLFAAGQACLRTSPLAKRYGWGIHYNDDEKIALYAVESSDYVKFVRDKSLVHKKAMSSKKK
jgi:Family of unknown function (DUF6157)